jgi:hypothetical protein
MSDTQEQNTNVNTQEKEATQAVASTVETQTSKPEQGHSKDFAELRKNAAKMAKELEAYKLADKTASEKKLEEEGKFKELAAKKDEEIKQMQEKYSSAIRTQTLEKLIAKEGVNPELADLVIGSIQSKVTFNENNEPENLTEVIAQLKTDKPSLFGGVTKVGNIGIGVTRTADNTGSITVDQAHAILESGNSKDYIRNRDAIFALRAEGKLNN